MKTQGLKKGIKDLLHKKGEVVIVFVVMILLVVLSTILEPRFLTFRNIYSLIRSFLPLLLVTFGQCLVMSAMGGVDLSVGGMISATNCLFVIYMREGFLGSLLPTLGVIVFGIVIGTINGLLVSKGGLQPLIVTLAMNLALSGISLLVCPVPVSPPTLNMDYMNFLSYGLGGYFPMVLFIAVTVIMWLFMYRTRTGRACVAVGGNEFSAVCSNIDVGKIKITAFIGSALLGVLAGIYMSGQMYSADSQVGSNMINQTITAAAVGGTSLAGGKPSIIGCVIGVFIIYITNNILNLTGVSFYYQYLLQGGMLVLALGLAALRGKRRGA